MGHVVARVYMSNTLFGLENEVDPSILVEIYIPSYKAVVTKDYVDTYTQHVEGSAIKIITLEHYIECLLGGKLWAISLLNAPSDKVVKKSHIWELLVFNRFDFVSKNCLNVLQHIKVTVSRHAKLSVPFSLDALQMLSKEITSGIKASKRLLGDIDYKDIQAPPFIQTNHTQIPGKPARSGIRLNGKVYTEDVPLSQLKQVCEKLNVQMQQSSFSFAVANHQELAKATLEALVLMQLIENSYVQIPLTDEERVSMKAIRSGTLPLDVVLNVMVELIGTIEARRHRIEDKVVDSERWINFAVSNYRKIHAEELKKQ